MMYFTKTHEWVEVENEIAKVGVSKFGVKEFGTEIIGVTLPGRNCDVIAGNAVAVLESNSSTSDVYSPLSGTVKETNRMVREMPEMILQSPERLGWLFKLENIDESELDELMDAAGYAEYLKTLE